jgi:AcrR family transcriptional regulator
MPKKVDHLARRTQIADALMRLAATQGLEAVSLRHVATEAGVSTGMVQHYFRTKDEMMTFALDVVSDRVQQRLAADRLGEDPPPKSVVRALLIQLLPLDEPRRLEGHLTLAFLAYAAVKPDIAATLREGTAQMRAFIADQIRAARAGSDADTDPARAGSGANIDPAHAATALLALVEGLGLHVLGQHYSPEVALAAFDAQLDAVFR